MWIAPIRRRTHKEFFLATSSACYRRTNCTFIAHIVSQIKWVKCWFYVVLTESLSGFVDGWLFLVCRTESIRQLLLITKLIIIRLPPPSKGFTLYLNRSNHYFCSRFTIFSILQSIRGRRLSRLSFAQRKCLRVIINPLAYGKTTQYNKFLQHNFNNVKRNVVSNKNITISSSHNPNDLLPIFPEHFVWKFYRFLGHEICEWNLWCWFVWLRSHSHRPAQQRSQVQEKLFPANVINHLRFYSNQRSRTLTRPLI